MFSLGVPLSNPYLEGSCNTSVPWSWWVRGDRPFPYLELGLSKTSCYLSQFLAANQVFGFKAWSFKRLISWEVDRKLWLATTYIDIHYSTEWEELQILALKSEYTPYSHCFRTKVAISLKINFFPKTCLSSTLTSWALWKMNKVFWDFGNLYGKVFLSVFNNLNINMKRNTSI